MLINQIGVIQRGREQSQHRASDISGGGSDYEAALCCNGPLDGGGVLLACSWLQTLLRDWS